MRYRSAIIPTILALFLLLASGCVDDEKYQFKEHGDTCRVDLAGLEKWIAIPVAPRDVWWEHWRMGDDTLGPADYMIAALITTADTATLARLARQNDPEPLREVPLDLLPHCVPDSVRARLKKEGGMEAIRCDSPKPFERSPLLHGWYMVIGADAVLVVMTST